ncbi:MAG: hypothetical protein J5I90_11955 [Caldilineales bacterium]|nr:hypothetical protein [Caldilineales bacterium]
MILTSRQLATITWLVIFVVWALTNTGVRKSIRSLLVTLFSLKLIILFTVIIGYNVAMVLGLWRVGYWDVTMLYDTVVFIAIGAISSVSRAASRGVTYDRRFFFKTLLVNLEVMVVFVFLLDFYPFRFWVEFLLIIPFFTLLGILVVGTEHKENAKKAHQLFKVLQASIGLLLIAYVLWQVVKNYEQLMHIETLFSLWLPFVMSLLFMPVLFLLCAVFAYEDAFVVLSLKGRDNERLTRWKKQRLFLHFGLNLKALQMFRRSTVIHEYAREKSADIAIDCLNSWSDNRSSRQTELE